jgi:hypothetical protein
MVTGGLVGLVLACSSSETSTPSGGAGMAGRVDGSTDMALDELLGSLQSICDALQSCYPTFDNCEGPADDMGDPSMVAFVRWPSADADFGSQLTACAAQATDRTAALNTLGCWSQAAVAANTCLSACPLSVQACADEYTAAQASCGVAAFFDECMGASDAD